MPYKPWHKMRGLTKVDVEVLDRIGMDGAVLSVPRDGSAPQLVPTSRPWCKIKEAIGVERTSFERLLKVGLISPLTADRCNDKAGWTELGVDGISAEIFLCTQ